MQKKFTHKKVGLLTALFFTSFFAQAQIEVDSLALDSIIVEKYYVSDADDATDTDGGMLPEGSVTYRVYADLKPGYDMQAVFGNARNTLLVKTSTAFFNNEDRGEETGDVLPANRLVENTVALDSWVTINAASDEHAGILKADDSDGSIVGGDNNDGGSQGIPGGLLVNDDASAGIPVTTADGLVDTAITELTIVGLDLGMFGDENSTDSLKSNNGSWAVLGEVFGPDSNNRVLLGQFTTDGILTLNLNIQIGIPDSLQCGLPDCPETIQFVSELHPEDEPKNNVFVNNTLTYSSDSDSTIDAVNEYANQTIDFSIYPNPADDVMTLRINPDNRSANASYMVVDARGKVVLEQALGNISSEKRVTLDISTLPKGVYLIQTVLDNLAASKHFIKL